MYAAVTSPGPAPTGPGDAAARRERPRHRAERSSSVDEPRRLPITPSPFRRLAAATAATPAGARNRPPNDMLGNGHRAPQEIPGQTRTSASMGFWCSRSSRKNPQPRLKISICHAPHRRRSRFRLPQVGAQKIRLFGDPLTANRGAGSNHLGGGSVTLHATIP